MKLRKLFAMLLSLAMVAGLLAGCGGDTTTSEPPASEPGTTSEAPSEEPSETVEPVTLNVA